MQQYDQSSQLTTGIVKVDLLVLQGREMLPQRRYVELGTHDSFDARYVFRYAMLCKCCNAYKLYKVSQCGPERSGVDLIYVIFHLHPVVMSLQQLGLFSILRLEANSLDTPLLMVGETTPS